MNILFLPRSSRVILSSFHFRFRHCLVVLFGLGIRGVLYLCGKVSETAHTNFYSDKVSFL